MSDGDRATAHLPSSTAAAASRHAPLMAAFLVLTAFLTWPLAIALISSGRINLQGLVTHRFSLPETAAALENTSTAPESLKAMIHPQRT